MTKFLKAVPVEMLCIVMVFSLFTAPVFAASEKTITYDYYYEADSPDDLSYSADKEIEIDGKHYRLTDVKTELYSEPITEKKTLKSKNKDADEYITKTVEGTDIKLYAPGEIKWENTNEPVTVTKEYKTEAEIPDTLEYEDKQLILKSKDSVSKKETVSTTAKFYSDSDDTDEFVFNGKVVVLKNGEPKWSGWKDDYAEYLGIENNNDYSITNSKWNGKAKKQSDGTYIRYATVYGTKKVNYWAATYGLSDESAEYEAEVTYTSKYIGHATVTYERYLTMKEKMLLVAAGIGVVALAAALILFFLSKRRKKEDNEESVA